MSKLFDWSEIKQRGDCRDFMKRDLGLTPTRQSKDTDFHNCPWRSGSDSESFAVKQDVWYDHVAKEGGSILDLAARAKFSGNMMAAQQYLGEALGLTPMQTKQAAPQKNIAATYDYLDINGILIHQTVRYEPKSFAQRRPDPKDPDRWIYDLQNIEPLLYRLPDWEAEPQVIIVEGEKDVDNLYDLGFHATTAPMGADKWRDSFTQWLTNKHIVILPDNDGPGRSHAKVIAAHLRDTAKSIKIIDLTGLPEKGDISDWIAAGHTKDELDQLILDAEDIISAKNDLADHIAAAKAANAEPFRNYTWGIEKDHKGNNKDVRVPRTMAELVDDINTRFLGFPRMLGNVLFDHDKDTGRIREIRNAPALTAWISSTSKKNSEFSRIAGAITEIELMEQLKTNATRYSGISMAPLWPDGRNDVYFAQGNIPDPSSDHHIFDEFLAFFHPESEVDRIMLKAFFMTAVYYRRSTNTPLFVFDSNFGKGVGKTTVVQMMAKLSGGSNAEQGTPITVQQADFDGNRGDDKLTKRVLSGTGRSKRILLIDNVEGRFSSPALAAMLTEPAITGMSPYGRGEETRINDLIYTLTSNSATLSADLITRSIMIFLKRPDESVCSLYEWSGKILAFIDEHRLQILADILDLITQGCQFDFTPTSRFPTWERDVLAVAAESLGQMSDVWKAITERRELSDGDGEEAETIERYFADRIGDAGPNPDLHPCWIQSNVVKRWVREAVDGFGGKTGRGALHHLRNLVKDQKITRLSDDIKVFPHHGSERRRGMFWNIDIYQETEQPVYVLTIDGETIVASEHRT